MKQTLIILAAVLSLAIGARADTVTIGNVTYSQATNANGQFILTPVSTNGTGGTVIQTPSGPVTITTAANGPLELVWQYASINDPTYNGWTNNYLMLWQAAVFANVNGVAGASQLGNDFGVEIPIHKYNLHIDEVTRFEQLFGDVANEQLGLGYDWNVHQIHMDGGLACRDSFAEGNKIQGLFFASFAKASTTLGGSVFLRANVLFVTKDQLEGEVGIQWPLGPKS